MDSNTRVTWSRRQVLSPVKIHVKEADENEVSDNGTNNPGQFNRQIVRSVVERGARTCESDYDWDPGSDPVSYIRFLTRPEEEENGNSSPEKTGRTGLKGRSTSQNSNGNQIDQGENVLILIPEQPKSQSSSDDHIPRYLHVYLDLMYYICLSPYDRNKRSTEDQTKCQYTVSIIQKIIFWCISTLSALQSFGYTKYAILQFLYHRELDDMIRICFHVIMGLLKGYGIYFLVCRQKSIADMLKIWDKFQADTNYVHEKLNQSQSKKDLLILRIVLVLSILFIPIFKAFLNQNVIDQSINELILDKSEDMSETLFMWKPNQIYNDTMMLNTTHITATTVTIGLIGIIVEICSQMQIDALQNLLLMTVLVNNRQVQRFGEKLFHQLHINQNSLYEPTEDITIWQTYRSVKLVSITTNDTFDVLHPIGTISNFFLLSYFLIYSLDKAVDHVHMMFMTYNLIKTLYFYQQARKSAENNDICRKWLQTLPCDNKLFIVGNVHYSRGVMLHELEKEPLGFGKGKFHISDEFLFTFFGLVGSLFCLIVNVEQGCR